MNDTLTPPPAAAPAAPPPRPAPSGGGAGRTVAIIAIVLGALVLLGTIGNAVVATARDAMRVSGTWTASARDVASLDVDADDASFSVEFGDVDEAELRVENARADWRIERDGDRLVVRSPFRVFGGWGGWNRGREGDVVVLTLPESLRGAGLDADLSLSAGELRADADFGDLALDLSGGAMTVTGSAETLVTDVSAGQVEVDLEDVSEATVSVSAGRVVGDLTGTAPDTVGIDVSAGSVELGLPAGPYDVTSDVSAGDFANRLDVSPSSPRTVWVEIAAGRVQLTEAR